MSDNKEMREAQIFFGIIAAVFAAWMVQVVAAALSGISTVPGDWGDLGSDPAMLWGVAGHVTRFWIVDALTWAALISLGVAVVMGRRWITGDKDEFTYRRGQKGGLGVDEPAVLLGAIATAIVPMVVIGMVLNPVAGVVLGLLLASGPAVALVRWGGRDKEELPGDRIILGVEDGQERAFVCARPDMSVFLLGAPSSGKTGGLIIPNLLQWDGVAVSTSTKMDIAQETSRLRSQLGQVWIWAPLDTGLELPPGAHRLGYSPISGAQEWKVASRHAHALAYGTASGESSKVWASSASQLIACALHACAISGEGMQRVIDTVKQPEWRWLKRTLTDNAEADPQALVALGSLEGRNATFRADMSANIDQALSLVLSGNLVDGGEGEQLDWREFLNGRNTLYIVLPTELPHVDPAPYVNVLLADLVYAVRDVASAHQYRLPHRLLMLLDELGALCSIDNLDNLIATQRSAGMSFLLSAQSLAQIDRRYGQNGARTIRDAVGAIVLGMGVSDDQALHDMETLVGGGVSLQQRMGSGKDDRQVVEDVGDRWAKHQIAGLQQFHFYVHLKGSDRPRHVRAQYFMDPPFRALWEGKVTASAATVDEVLGDEIADDQIDGQLSLAPIAHIVDKVNGEVIRVLEEVWTRIIDPGLNGRIAAIAADQQLALAGIPVGHDVRGVHVEHLNRIPVNHGQPTRPVQGEIQMVGDDGRPEAVDQVTDENIDKAIAAQKQGKTEDEPQAEAQMELQFDFPESAVALPSVLDDFDVDDAFGDIPGGVDLDEDGLISEPEPVEEPALPPVLDTPVVPPERPNRYVDTCVVCKKRVDAQRGLMWRKIDRWVVRHPDCKL